MHSPARERGDVKERQRRLEPKNLRAGDTAEGLIRQLERTIVHGARRPRQLNNAAVPAGAQLLADSKRVFFAETNPEWKPWGVPGLGGVEDEHCEGDGGQHNPAPRVVIYILEHGPGSRPFPLVVH